AFEGYSNWGAGVCVDSVAVVEKGYIPKRLNNLTVKPVTSNFIPTGSENNLLSRVDFQVVGNTGDVLLDSIAFKSLNTSDTDVSTNGVKLFFTEDTVFNTSNQIGTSQDFSDGIVVFDNLDKSLPYDYSSVWLCYDIKEDLEHELHNNIADVMIEENAIKVSGYTYPFSDKSPDGSRIINESIFLDYFETDLGWVYSGEFERDSSQGLGSGGYYCPDPEYAYSGKNIIGTDLTGLGLSLGDYEKSMTSQQDKAVSPTINAKYYKDVSLVFQRWLNFDNFDNAYIDISTDNGVSWVNNWQSSNYYNDRVWKQIDIDVSENIDRIEKAKIRFAIGPTNNSGQAGGWNIDNFVIVGNFLSKDVGVSNWIAPLGGCGHSDEEYVEITIQNFAGKALTDTLVLSYSFDGGTTIIYDTIANPNIPIDGLLNYTITKPVDLTSPGWYNNVYATTNLTGDEDNSNNRINKSIFISPTYDLPYYENFENNYGYYLSGGRNSTWEYGIPNGTLIDNAASGDNAWLTNLSGNYNYNDSSYLESPCFNFAGSDSIVFEFKCKGISEDKTDGLALLYSIDDGVSWSLVNDDNDYYWNWYTETTISELEYPGIDTTNGEWLVFRQLLPPELSNQSSAKFKFVFESNDADNDEGFGIDDIKIFDAPYDVGVTSLEYPYNRCEWNDTTHVKIYIKNYGPKKIASGTKIPLVLNFNSSVISDTLTLTTDLATDNSVLFTFNSTVDMSYAGDYDFSICTKLESDPYFYNDTFCNDTLVSTITVMGMPRYNPFPEIIGDEDQNLTLDAGAGFTNYLWQDASTDQTYDVTSEGEYNVTVTNGDGCTAIDSVEIVASETDLTMDSLYTELEDSCSRESLTQLSVHFINNSINSIDLVSGDTIFMGYQINDNLIDDDTLVLSENIPVGDTVWFTYNKKADFITPENYTLKVFTNFIKDLNHNDDTISVNFNTKGYVDVELNYDTVYSSQADTLEIIGSPDYANYVWTPAGANDTISPINNESAWYKVTVSDNFVCGEAYDSVYIETYDVGISAVTSPDNNCEDLVSENTAINVEVTNYSDNIYSSPKTVKIFYELDNAAKIEVNPELDLGANASETLSNIATIDIREVGEHTLKIYTSSDIDANNYNDTLVYTFNTWPLPNVDLAGDTIFTSQADTVVLVAQEGFATYNWNDESTNDSLIVSEKYSANYIVTVTDVYGCGDDSDSTQIITNNVGVISMISPTSVCEHGSTEEIKIAVKNFSYDTLLAGTVIPVAYNLEGYSAVKEDFILSTKLDPLSSANYTFDDEIDLSDEGIYKFNLYTDFENDVNNINDTLKDAIKTFGYPDVDLGDDIYTTEPTTVTLSVPSGYNNYKWDDGSISNVFNVSYIASKLYSVTVTDINGCATADDVNVYTYNLASSSLINPVSQCEFTSSEDVSITIENLSEDTIPKNADVNVAYKLNSDAVIYETLSLNDTLFPAGNTNYSFAQKADLSVNQLHKLKIFANHLHDADYNDTLNIDIDYQKPNFNLGDDVITGDTQYTINAGSGYVSYEWFDGSTNNSYTIDVNNQTANNYYSVKVINSNTCDAKDSIKVTFDVSTDLGVINLISPESECWQSEKNYQVETIIKNLGNINISSGTSLNIGYKIGTGNPVIETMNLLSDFNVNETLNYVFDNEIIFNQANIYEFKPFVKYSEDEDADNDTLFVDVDISQPNVDLGRDTIYFTNTYVIDPAGDYDIYEWSTGSESSSITVSETATYSLTVTDFNGCQASDSIYCENTTGIDNLIKGKGYIITYYPNPVSEKLRLEIANSELRDLFFELINTQGQCVYNKKFSITQNTIENIDVRDFASGVYYMRFRIAEEFHIRKLIIR
nr:T9SS type A sorting domain-containing protein [Bacteroidales bacterium]